VQIEHLTGEGSSTTGRWATRIEVVKDEVSWDTIRGDKKIEKLKDEIYYLTGIQQYAIKKLER
jgi:hypothetical protein